MFFDRLQSQHLWYGSGDGKHIFLATMELRSENTSVWNSFRWPVALLESIQKLPTLRQLTRYINGRHHRSVYIETTLFETLYGIRQDCDLLCVNHDDRRLPTGIGVAKADNSGNMEYTCSESMQSTIQMSQTTIRLDICVIEALWKIMNEKRPEVVIKKKQFRNSDV